MIYARLLYASIAFSLAWCLQSNISSFFTGFTSATAICFCSGDSEKSWRKSPLPEIFSYLLFQFSQVELNSGAHCLPAKKSTSSWIAMRSHPGFIQFFSVWKTVDLCNEWVQWNCPVISYVHVMLSAQQTPRLCKGLGPSKRAPHKVASYPEKSLTTDILKAIHLGNFN